MEEQQSLISQIPVDKNAHQNIPSAEVIQDWLVCHVAQMINVSPQKIDITTPLNCYGLDSFSTLSLLGDMESWLGYEIDSTLIYNYPTIKGLTGHLSLHFQAEKSKVLIVNN
jgi:acyl carrier protein